MKTGFWATTLTALFLAASPPALSEDIDLFAGPNLASTNEVPNVLILLDNTANWNTAFTNEIAALVSTLNALPENKFRVGLMLFTETGSGDSNADGGYVRAAVRLMDATNKPLYQNLVNSLDVGNDKSNGGKAGKTMVEVYRYFSGLAPYAGNQKNKTDYTGNVFGTAASKAIYARPGNAIPSKSGSPYTSPIIESCAKNFLIYISNGAVQDNNSDTTAATTELTAAGGSTTAIPLSPSGSQDNIADEWARYLKKSNVHLTTYTVDVDKVTTGQGPGWTSLLKSMANVSDGKYFNVSSAADSGKQISDALGTIFSEIQAVNSVFAAVSLPVSVNTQGTYLNQVFVGMFRPDGDAFPRWAGNLKQYRLGMLTGNLRLLDANEATPTSAINPGTGFITECARSYWTPTTTDSYWAFHPLGECLSVSNSAQSNYPDGNIVEKGAQAYKLRSTTTRTLKTCASDIASCTSLTNFDSTNTAITETLLGTTPADKTSLINWSRGLDVLNENGNDPTINDMRPSAHADVVHSRPVAINFGSDASPKVVVFYGGNDGILRAINGNRSANIGSVTPGMELWAFMAPEFYPHLKRLRDNSPQISYQNLSVPPTSPTPQPKRYGFDGVVAAYKTDSVAWIYATMRRGGRVLYAFNANVSDPSNITLKWKKGCPNFADDTGCTSGFTAIGQTWSAPKILKSSGYGSGASPMLIMGGGYDSCEDSDPNSCTSSAKGNRIFVLDADTGNLLQTLNTDRGVTGDIVVVPDASGLARYAYAADLGGNVYRITIGGAAPASWTITKIASLGCDTVSSCTDNRKFLFGPDVAEENGEFIILLGSGDREKPLNTFTHAAGVTNYFFMLRDKPSEATWLSSEAANCSGSSVMCLNSLLPITSSATPTQAALAAKKGWYLGLSAKEQVVTAAITIFGVANFSTHIPAEPTPGTCGSNLGTARTYNIAYTNAASATGTSDRFMTLPAGGLPPSPVAGYVILDDGSKQPFCIGCTGTSPLEAKKPPVPPSSTPVQPKGRVYWYIQR